RSMMVRYPRLGLRCERLHSRSWNGTGCPCAPHLSRGRTPWMPPMNPLPQLPERHRRTLVRRIPHLQLSTVSIYFARSKTLACQSCPRTCLLAGFARRAGPTKVLARRPSCRSLVAKRDRSRKAFQPQLQRVRLSPEFLDQVVDLLALA